MRILYTTTEDYYFVSHRLPMARAARAAGFEVHVAARENAHGSLIRSEGFTLHPIPFARGEIAPAALLSNARAVRSLVNNLAPDLVHHIGVQMSVVGGSALAGITTPQIHSMTGLGYAFTGDASRARFVRMALSAVLKVILNRKHTTALVQNQDDRAALERIGIDPRKIALIAGSGVDTDKFQPLPEPDGPVTVGFAGRLLRDKGIVALVAAHAILQTRGLNTQLLIAGEPDPANPASVSHQDAEQWATRPGVSWLGHVSDIETLWRRAHIAALPSHREGMPLSLLEAAAAGRPMIATDAPGCREIVVHGNTGLLVPVENPEAIADAIAKLARSRDLRIEYGANARKLVEDKMSTKVIGAATVALYRSLR